jgi:hypothetical protein
MIAGVGLLLAPAVFLLTVAPIGVALGCVLLMIGVLMFFRMPTAEAFLVGTVPRRHLSTVLGLYFFAGMEAGGVLTPLVGHLIDRRGFRTGFLVVATAAGLIALFCGVALLRVARQRRGVVGAA